MTKWKSRIQVAFAEHDYTIDCAGCDRELYNGKEKVHVSFIYEGQVLCVDCLRILRSKIDALTLLIQTGIDTK